jgi:hypothetical protein
MLTLCLIKQHGMEIYGGETSSIIISAIDLGE